MNYKHCACEINNAQYRVSLEARLFYAYDHSTVPKHFRYEVVRDGEVREELYFGKEINTTYANIKGETIEINEDLITKTYHKRTNTLMNKAKNFVEKTDRSILLCVCNYHILKMKIFSSGYFAKLDWSEKNDLMNYIKEFTINATKVKIDS